jgi:S-adenosylmethionine-dependent methyltransferase
MAAGISEFDARVAEWEEHKGLPWGRLLYSTSHLNLQRHIEGRCLRVLDVGGGTGVDAAHLAGLGHSVVMMDCSAAMLAEARKAAAERGVLDRMTLYQADVTELPGFVGDRQFDLILCHMMIEFVPEPRALLRYLVGLLAPDGLLSVIDTNRYSQTYALALRVGDLSAACEAIDAKQYFHPWVNRITPRFSADEIIDMLAAKGLDPVGHYGILSLCAYLPNEPKFDPDYFAELELLEHRLADMYPYHLLARFFHVIMRRDSRHLDAKVS